MSKEFYLKGAHNKTCDRSGFVVKSTDTIKEWNGRIVRREDYEPRHPHDLIRARPDRPGVKDARPLQSPHFLATNEVTRSSL